MKLSSFCRHFRAGGDKRRLRSIDPARNWIPACAGMTTLCVVNSRLLSIQLSLRPQNWLSFIRNQENI